MFLLPIQQQIIFLISVKIIAVGLSGLVSERFARLRPLHQRRVDMNSDHSRKLLYLALRNILKKLIQDFVPPITSTSSELERHNLNNLAQYASPLIFIFI